MSAQLNNLSIFQQSFYMFLCTVIVKESMNKISNKKPEKNLINYSHLTIINLSLYIDFVMQFSLLMHFG